MDANHKEFDARMRAETEKADCPIPEGFEVRLEERLNSLPERRGQGRRLGRRIAALAAAAILLTVSVLAVSPSLREQLSLALGSFEPYSQGFNGVAAVDQDIEIQVLSAVTDQYRVRFYIQLTDLSGQDRLDDHVNLRVRLNKDWGEDNIVTVGSFGECVGYDPDTGAAILELEFYGFQPGEAIEDLTLEIAGIRPGRYRFETKTPLPKELVTETMLETITLENGRQVLAPGQTEAPLDGFDKAELSSMGFAPDGSFQVLFRLAEGAVLEESDILTTVYLNGETGVQNIGDFQYTMDGAAYTGIIYYGVEPEDLEGMSLTNAYGTVAMGEEIDGVWSLPFQVENLPCLELELTGEIGEHPMESKLALTPLGAMLTGDYGVGYRGRAHFAVLYRDGSRFEEVEKAACAIGEGAVCTLGNWIFDEPVELENVAAVELGDWYISTAGEDAGTVYPLNAHP